MCIFYFSFKILINKYYKNNIQPNENILSPETVVKGDKYFV